MLSFLPQLPSAFSSLVANFFLRFCLFVYHDDVTLFTLFNLNHQNCWAFWPAVGSAVLPADLSKKKKALLIKEVSEVSSSLLGVLIRPWWFVFAKILLSSPSALCAQSSKWISIKITIQAALATPITQFQATLRGRHLPYDVAQTENVAEWRTSVCSSHASEHRRPLANDKQFVNFTEERFILKSQQKATHHGKGGKECSTQMVSFTWSAMVHNHQMDLGPQC